MYPYWYRLDESPNSDAPNTAIAHYLDSNSWQVVNCQNRALSKLEGKISNAAELGAAIFEGNQSLQMIAHRTQQLVSGARAMKRGNWLGVYKNLRGFTKEGAKAAAKRGPRNFSRAWLEYNYGWKPLAQDIYNAVDLVSSPQQALQQVQSGAQHHYEWKWGNGSAWNWTGSARANTGVRLYGLVVVTNPNWHLRNRLGLINPVSVAWELVPFSFCVDWFVDIGSYIKNMNRWAGVTWYGAGTSIFRDGYSRSVYNDPHSGPKVASGYSRRFERRKGLPPYKVQVPEWARVFNNDNWRRGANAIALLVQSLTSGGRR